jgi:hypothetical protein
MMKRLSLVPVLSILIVAACGGGSGSGNSSSTNDDSVEKGKGCENAGGSCVALAPGACSGTVMSEAKYSCETGGAIGLECCMPTGGCQKSSDCHGALPRIEEKCSDGSFSGASWQCLRLNGPGGFCSVSFCEGKGGPTAGASGDGGDNDGGPASSSESDGGSSGMSDGGNTPEDEDGGTSDGGESDGGTSDGA